MKTYYVSFTGRLKNALGICYHISDTVQAVDEQAALLALYDKYEHISFPKFTVEMVHYGLTREEFASNAGKHPSCFDNRLKPICNNGNYHAVTTRDKAKVTCPVCLAKIGM